MLFSDESTFQLVSGKNGFRVLSPADQRDHPSFHQRQKQKQMSVMYGGAAEQTTWVTEICAKVPLTWRHILGLYRDIYCCRDDNSLHLYTAFLSTQCALDCQGVSPHLPLVCSIHLDDATAAIVCQNSHHTPAYWWRGYSDEANQQVLGLLGGHDDHRPIGKFGQDAEVTPLLFSKGIFNDHRESGPRFNVLCEGRCF